MQFLGRISKMGENKVIWIPKEYHNEIPYLEGKPIRITMEDPLFETLELLRDKFLTTVDQNNRIEIINAMSSFGKPALRHLAYVIQFTVDENVIQYTTRKIVEINALS